MSHRNLLVPFLLQQEAAVPPAIPSFTVLPN